MLLLLLRSNELHYFHLQLFINNLPSLSKFKGLIQQRNNQVFNYCYLTIRWNFFLSFVEVIADKDLHDFPLVVWRVHFGNFFL